jgi:serine/threonine protein phosphatase PrpC
VAAISTQLFISNFQVMKFWKRNSNHRPATSELIGQQEEQVFSCRVYGLSETGPTRSSNEDCIFSFYPDRHHETFFAMVADGMGGHNAGEIASSIACATARNYIQINFSAADSRDMLEQLVHVTNANIREAAAANEEYSGMGTTATMLFIQNRKMCFAHVGDSRLYHMDNKKLVQLSKDHTLVQQMVDEGTITTEQASVHKMKNVLLQALGTLDHVDPETGVHEKLLTEGDVFFLCSDGVYDVLKFDELESILQLPAKLAIECIKALCMQRKASDNFSALIVTVSAEKSHADPVTREQNIML